MAELTKEQIAKFDTINVIELPDKTMYRLESVSSKGDPLITQTIKKKVVILNMLHQQMLCIK